MIKWLKIILLIVVVVLAMAAGITLAHANKQDVSLSLIVYQFPESSLGVVVSLTLFIGAFVGLLLSYLPILFGRRSVKSRDRKIKKLEKELSQLRAAAVKG